VSLALGIVVLACAVFLGGLAALFRDPARGVLSLLRTFAVVAAASIALLHLLPEAIAAVGWGALAAAGFGAFGPILLERLFPAYDEHTHEAPTTSLAMGYAAVVAHQAGEGAVLASLAETGALSAGIVVAIAAHTVPLSMVVGIRVLEVRGRAVAGSQRAIALALLGVALATAGGACLGSLLGAARLSAVQPWLLAVVAGLLLHALSHDALAAPLLSGSARTLDTLAGWAGLALASFGVEDHGWAEHVPSGLRAVAVLVLAGAIAARSFLGREQAQGRVDSS
jgi:ZIP family zinc transporter